MNPSYCVIALATSETDKFVFLSDIKPAKVFLRLYFLLVPKPASSVVEMIVNAMSGVVPGPASHTYPLVILLPIKLLVVSSWAGTFSLHGGKPIAALRLHLAVIHEGPYWSVVTAVYCVVGLGVCKVVEGVRELYWFHFHPMIDIGLPWG